MTEVAPAEGPVVSIKGTPIQSVEPIAIVGIGCRFPGDANNPDSFWSLLCRGTDAVGEIPEDRWNLHEFYDPLPGMPGKTYSRWGGFLRTIDQFAPECFGISPREAAHMDPQQRLLLEVSWEALEDAGYPIERLAGTATGVFIGVSTSDYAWLQSGGKGPDPVDAHAATGEASSITANRISYCLNLRGPSLAVDTACSSSLVATDLACQSLWSGQCDYALAGGVNVIISPSTFIAFCAASMLSPEGRCKAFDASANGFVRGEGAGIVVLKKLSRALADGDLIYALIAGSAVNQDGRTNGIGVPSQSAQEALVRVACQKADIDPRAVHYVEAHGTGTAVGDPIEARALGGVLSKDRPVSEACVVGSVKTNIGHLEAAAGIAGIIKTALILKHRTIPPNLHFSEPNPNIPFEDLKLRVPVRTEAWEDKGPAVAGVNSFGIGGTNAHVVMMEYRQEAATPHRSPETDLPMLFPLSARSPEALQALAKSYRNHLGNKLRSGEWSVPALCHTASVGRSHFDHRAALVVSGAKDFEQKLNALLANETVPGLVTGKCTTGQSPRPVFVFSGQGPQWWAMGRQLLENAAVFRTTIEECDRLFGRYAVGPFWKNSKETSPPRGFTKPPSHSRRCSRCRWVCWPYGRHGVLSRKPWLAIAWGRLQPHMLRAL
jgi:acyl transferase domain-containing protein